MTEQASIEILTEARIADAVKRNKIANVVLLQEMAQHIAHEELEYPASAVVVITLGPDGPNVTWRGIDGVDQLQDAARAMQAVDVAYRIGYRRGSDVASKSPTEIARGDAERRRRGAIAQKELERRKQAETPWRCEHCDEGFKTARGATMHESRSEKRGCPRCKTPKCMLRGFSRDQAGNVTSCQKCHFTGEPRYVKPSEASPISSDLRIVNDA